MTITPDHLFHVSDALKKLEEKDHEAYIKANSRKIVEAFAEYNKPDLTPTLVMGYLILKNHCQISLVNAKLIHDILQASRCANAA